MGNAEAGNDDECSLMQCVVVMRCMPERCHSMARM